MDSHKNEEDKGKKPEAAAVGRSSEGSGGEVNAAPAVKSRRGRHKRPKDMPPRPLSAYNLFFAEERERILYTQRQGIAQPDFVYPSEAELQQHASTGKKKPPALFQALAKCIGGRWRALPQNDRSKYEVQAKEQMRLYRQKIATYQHAMVVKSIAESDEKKRVLVDAAEGSEGSDKKPPAKKAKHSFDCEELKTSSDEKDETLLPQQIQFHRDSWGSLQSKTAGGPPYPEGGPDLERTPRHASAKAKEESPAAQMSFYQYIQQEQVSSNTAQTGLAGGTIGPPLAGLQQLPNNHTQHQQIDPVGNQNLPSSGSALSFFNRLAMEQLSQAINPLPARSAFSQQGQSDLFLQNLALIHQDQQNRQIQRVLSGISSIQGNATDITASLLHQLNQQLGREQREQQQQLQQHQQQALQGNQGALLSLLQSSLQHAAGGGRGGTSSAFSLDASQQSAAAFRGGQFSGLTDLLVQLQEQQRQRQQASSNQNTQGGQQNGPT